ncbi:MAG: hypothetical protein AB1644_07290 [Candidatus Zixiibacteriota bacterium]
MGETYGRGLGPVNRKQGEMTVMAVQGCGTGGSHSPSTMDGEH